MIEAISKHRIGFGRWMTLLLLLLSSFFLAGSESEWRALWPSFTALLMVFATRSALFGLLTGAVVSAILIAGASPTAWFGQLVTQQFAPIFSSPWKLSAILFTLILGGFVALVEAGGGLQALVRRLLGSGRAPAKRMQSTVFGMGLLVFFDGLANTMLVGRLLRSAADRCGVSREKLAYLADTTGSAVACLAFVSTWIAFQLSMIREGFAIVGQEVNAYALFFKSLPTNFYCLFALFLAGLSVFCGYNPGAMGKAEQKAQRRLQETRHEAVESAAESFPPGFWLLAIVPIVVLTLSIPSLTYLIGAEQLWPVSLEKFASAYGEAERYVPQILVTASLLAAGVAAMGYTVARRLGPARTAQAAPAFRVFLGGVRDLIGPIFILLAAWMLGSGIQQLGLGSLMGDLLGGRMHPGLLPAAIFVVGAGISFSTGTSWGTMGVLMPLAIPLIFVMSGELTLQEQDRLIIAAIGAVFSGAVFGDHCSPFSDTTIVASIAAGVEPVEHVRTQLPYAGIAGLIAIAAGFIPLGFGLPVWLCLLAGAGLLIFTSSLKCAYSSK